MVVVSAREQNLPIFSSIGGMSMCCAVYNTVVPFTQMHHIAAYPRKNQFYFLFPMFVFIIRYINNICMYIYLIYFIITCVL